MSKRNKRRCIVCGLTMGVVFCSVYFIIKAIIKAGIEQFVNTECELFMNKTTVA